MVHARAAPACPERGLVFLYQPEPAHGMATDLARSTQLSSCYSERRLRSFRMTSRGVFNATSLVEHGGSSIRALDTAALRHPDADGSLYDGLA
jgi:hypothetical protein